MGDFPPFLQGHVPRRSRQFLFNRSGAWRDMCFSSGLLTRISGVIKDYCGLNSEEAIRKNFVLIYELLDEMLDFGYPQETSSEHLKAFVFNKAVLTDASPGGGVLGQALANLPSFGKTRASNNTNKPIAWDPKAKKASKNEIFVDLIERVTVLFNSNGSILKSEIDGCIRMKSYLQGAPELRLVLSEDLVVGRQGANVYGATVVDDITFHQACNLSDFERDKVVSLQAPEGECIVLNYRISGDFELPFRVYPFVEEVDDGRTDIVLKVRADIPEANAGAAVVVSLPVPRQTTSCKCSLPDNAKGQTTEYLEADKTVVWTIKKFPGQSEQQIRIRLSLPSSTAQTRAEIGPVTMDYEIPMWNPSTMAIRFLRIIERNDAYKPSRWVRVITQANSYTCRLNS